MSCIPIVCHIVFGGRVGVSFVHLHSTWILIMSLQQEGDENMTMLLCTLEISDELTTVWDSESGADH